MSVINYQRYQWIDVAKCIGILFVVFGHVFRGSVLKSHPDNQLLQIIDSIVYSFHMPMFFFLSGLLVLSSIQKRTVKEFFISKVDTIFYAYILWMVLQGSVEYLFASVSNKQSMELSGVFNILVPRSQFWYLYTLFLLMIISILLKWERRVMLGFLILLSIALYFLVAPSEIPIIKFLGRFSLFFFSGVYVGSKIEYFQSKLSNGSITFLFLLACVSFQYYFHFFLVNRYDDYSWLSLLLSSVTMLFWLSFSVVLSLSLHNQYLKLMVSVGKASILIYLGHLLTAGGARVFLTTMFPNIDVFLLVVLGTIFGVVPWVFIYYRFGISKCLYDGTYFRRWIRNL